MNDWVATTLKSVQLFAVENGFVDLANEMDVAILVAAEEQHRRLEAQAEETHVGSVERNRGEVVRYPGPQRVGRHH